MITLGMQNDLMIVLFIYLLQNYLLLKLLVNTKLKLIKYSSKSVMLSMAISPVISLENQEYLCMFYRLTGWCYALIDKVPFCDNFFFLFKDVCEDVNHL